MSSAIRACACAFLVCVVACTGGGEPPADGNPKVGVIEGPTKGRVNDAFDFSCFATDPQNDALTYEFDWDADATPDHTSASVASGAWATVEHVFTLAGPAPVRCRAKDAGGNAGPWSTVLQVVVGEASSGTDLQLRVAKDGRGRVTSSPAGIDCGDGCEASFAPSTRVTLTATPSTGASFVGWSGSCTGTTTAVDLTVDANRTCIATFADDADKFSVSLTTSGRGRVTSSPAGLDCGATCEAAFTKGAPVTLTAVPSAGAHFKTWGGDCSGTSATVSLSQGARCTAEFEDEPCQAKCRADQLCVNGECEFACSGIAVPGDYARIQAAVDALQNIGGTLCLGAQRFDESVDTRGGAFTIIGKSAARTRIRHLEVQPASTVVVKGVTVDEGLTASLGAGRAELVGVTLHSNGTAAVMVYAGNWSGLTSSGGIVLDGADVAPSRGPGLAISGAGYGSFTATIRNSVVHGATSGLSAYSSGTGVTLDVSGVTLLGNDYGILTGTGNATVKVVNSILAQHGSSALSLSTPASVSHHNALYGNAANFADRAVPGTNEVRADCLLDDTVPPNLGAGSPCLGAGDLSAGPDHDYWARPRTGRFDLGAVQGQ